MITLRVAVSRFVPGLFVVSLAAAACGGGLKYKVDDASLDSVAAGDRQPVFTAQSDLEMAKSEQRAAHGQLDELDRDHDIAKKEREQADLEVQKAETEQESATASHDENRANGARHGKEVADFGVKVAEAKLDWLSEKDDWLTATRKAADAHVDAAAAKVEWEKAKVAQAKGIKPSDDFSVSNFEAQWKDKNDDWESAKKNLASLQKKTKDREDKWNDLVAQQNKMK